MRILFVTPYVPSSVRVRPMALIRELARLGHEITLACLIQPAWEKCYLDQVKPFCRDVYAYETNRQKAILRTLISVPTPTPLSVAYCYSKELASLIKRLLDDHEYDLIHTEFIRAAPYTVPLKQIPKVFDAVDCLSLAHQRSLYSSNIALKQRIISLFEWMKLCSYERLVMEQYDRIIISSRTDAQNIGSFQKPIDILPNGVDTQYFSYDDRLRPVSKIVFLGKMSYYVNIASILWFYRKIFPLIRKQVPNIIFRIVGREPANEIKRLCLDPAVEVTGTVGDVRPYLADATIAICPMISGSGIQNKILEAMAVGTPCVATTLATQALNLQSGREIVIADDPNSFASAVVNLLGSPDKQREMAERGRDYVERNHNWPRIGRRLENVYASLVKNTEQNITCEG